MLQVHLEELLLLLQVIESLLNIVKSFFWAEMRLVVKHFDGLLCCLPLLLFCDLAPKEIRVLTVLMLPILSLEELHFVHVIDGRVELLLLVVSCLLYTLDLLVETA